MIKMIIAFAVLTTAIAIGITTWRDMKGKERWMAVKTIVVPSNFNALMMNK